MILTLTANPSTDRTLTLSGALRRGGVQRVEAVISQAGGKGVNISRAAVAAGEATLAVIPADTDDPFVRQLHAAGIACEAVPTSGPPRVNLTISEPDGTTTKLNSPGPHLDDAAAARLRDVLVSRAAGAAWVVLAGSLPPGAPEGWYAELTRALHGTSARVAVDTSEAPLRALVDAFDGDPAGCPDLMKPNGEELASLTGGDPVAIEADPAAAAAAARVLLDRGVGAVLATLGAGGAVLVTPEGAWHAAPPPTEVVSTVGAGDSSLFGYVLADLRGEPPAHRLALAVAYGSAAAGLPGTTIPEPSHVDPGRVRVSPLHDHPGASA